MPNLAMLMRGASQVAIVLGVALCGAVPAGAGSAGSPAVVAESTDPLAMESLMADPDTGIAGGAPADAAPERASRAGADVVPAASAPARKAADVKVADVKRDGSTGAASAGQGSRPAPGTSVAKNSAAKNSGDQDLDPEPDGITVPTTASPSNDPLDRPRPASGPRPAAAKPDPAKPGVANAPPKAGEPGKGDAATGPASPDPSKASAAKPDPAKTGDAKTGAAPGASGAPTAAAPAVAPEPPLPAANAAIKAVIDKRAAIAFKGPTASEKRKERDAVAFFYAAHGFAPAWSENGKPIAAVAPVLARLAKAGDDALSLTDIPTALKTDGSLDDVAASDVALTEAVVAYARQATGSRVDPHGISSLIGAKPELADPAEVLDGLIAAGPGAGDKLAALNPSEPRYIALREKLAEIRGTREPATHDDPQIADGPILKIGMRDARVPLLRARFNVEATGDADDADLVYDEDVAAAIKAFQRSHGIQPLGMLGARTVAALNGGPAAPVPSAKLEGVVVANMEMWRWMPRDMGRERIEVNVPDYAVTVFHDNEAVARNRVVVGKTDTPTPIFSNTMKFLIVNPVWNVPQSIIKNEFNGGTHGFKARYVHGQLYLQQPAGPGNALGRIKFMFPNQYSVYLHDTPSKHLFGATKRAFSHGCVRVDKPFEFAESVLNDAVPEGGTVVWNQKRLEKMLGTTERYVNLPTPLPIHIEYFTASVDGDGGKLNLREDIYGYAGAVAAALGYGKPPAFVADKKPASQVAERRPRPRRVARRSYDDGDGPRAAAEQPAQRSFFMPW